MPVAVGALVVILIAGAYLTSSTPTPADNALQITGTAGVERHREQFKYTTPVQTTPTPVVEVRASARTETVAPQPITPIKPIVTPLAPLKPAAPPDISPASACLGKYVGQECTYTENGVAQGGTCRTLSYSPVTCVKN